LNTHPSAYLYRKCTPLSVRASCLARLNN